MTEQLNIIFVSCNVFLDAQQHSENTDSQQKILKNHVHHLFNIAFKYIGQTNRIILISDNGAAMAYAGQPEDAVLMGKEILNGILLTNKQGSIRLSASVGIHLEPVHVVNDFNEQPNIIGNGINAAKRMMSKAQPNEILVSRNYYENIPLSIQALSTLSTDLDNTQENHALDDQISVAEINIEHVPENQPLVFDQPITSAHNLQVSDKKGFLNASNWKYAIASVFIVIALFSIANLAITPTNAPNKNAKILPSKTAQKSNLKPPSAKSEIQLQKTDTVKPADARKEVKQKTKNTVDSTSKKSASNKTISWESFKDSIRQGQKHECTQSEIAMNQCR